VPSCSQYADSSESPLCRRLSTIARLWNRLGYEDSARQIAK
jgi:hypothetical protein